MLKSENTRIFIVSYLSSKKIYAVSKTRFCYYINQWLHFIRKYMLNNVVAGNLSNINGYQEARVHIDL